ncbi:MAG: RNA polymerase sigma factor [Cyclobacteriaceae bacterium]
MADDRALVSQVISGDAEAFRQLIRQHERLVSHMVGRMVKRQEDREEVCQDVFMKVYEKLGEFNFQSQLSTWIATIAYRHGINHLRKKKVAISEIDDDERFYERFVADDNPESTLEEQDLDHHIMELIEKLPTQYKVVLTLYHNDGMSYAEIGTVTGMPEGTVKNYLFRARQLLKEKIKKHLGAEQFL